VRRCTLDNERSTADMDDMVKRKEWKCIGMDCVLREICVGFDSARWKALDREQRME
jgi:hypothetical protein